MALTTKFIIIYILMYRRKASTLGYRIIAANMFWIKVVVLHDEKQL